MAVDHPVVNLPAGRWLRNSRAFELGVVVALTVAVVVVAALWGYSSGSVVPGSVASLDSPSTDSAAQSSTDGSVIGSPDSAGSAERSVLSADSQGVELEHDQTMITTYSGLMREVPDFGSALLPDSFERYQVVRGETLISIASARDLSVSELLLWNLHLGEDSVLIPGEWISIPQWNARSVADEPNQGGEEGKTGRGGG